MTCLRFDSFQIDSRKRLLLRDGEPVALNARYFDALLLLAQARGELVSKQRFFDEVWAGSVVTDAALTQCIKDIRRALGDDAAAPRFVRTVPGRGYSFIAAVDAVDAVGAQAQAPAPAPEALPEWPPEWLRRAAGAALGGAAAGLLGGLLYGSVLAFAPAAQGLGSLSVLLVLLVLNGLVGLAGALAVGVGLSAGWRFGGSAGWVLGGAALGGFGVGGVTKLLASDAFRLLVGEAPAGLTGGLEGAVLGLAVAAGLLAGGGLQAPRPRRAVLWGAASTGLAGALLPLAGGSLMASSLARIAATFDGSRLDMAALARLAGEPQFGPLAQSALGGLEGALFGAGLVAGLLALRRR